MLATNTEEVKLPKLDAVGKEWITWKVWLQVAVASWGLGGYLNGMKTMPVHLAVEKAARWTLSSPAEVKSVSDYKTALETWCEKDSKVHHIMVNTLPNFLLMCLVNKTSAHEYFTALLTLFEQWLLVASSELWH